MADSNTSPITVDSLPSPSELKTSSGPKEITSADDLPSPDAIKSFNEEAAYNIIGNTVTNNDNVAFFQYNPTFNPLDKVVELYERLIASEREKVELLKKMQQK